MLDSNLGFSLAKGMAGVCEPGTEDYDESLNCEPNGGGTEYICKEGFEWKDANNPDSFQCVPMASGGTAQAAPAGAAAPTFKLRYVTASVLNLREGPGTEFDVIGKLTQGSQVNVATGAPSAYDKVSSNVMITKDDKPLNSPYGDWVYVSAENVAGKDGWTSAKYLSASVPQQKPATSSGNKPSTGTGTGPATSGPPAVKAGFGGTSFVTWVLLGAAAWFLYDMNKSTRKGA